VKIIEPFFCLIDVIVGTSLDDEAELSLTTLLITVGPESSPTPKYNILITNNHEKD
jgi:hypothetical protein